MSEPKIFKDEPDDTEYFAWRRSNSGGYVLNIKKSHVDNYPMMHRVKENGTGCMSTKKKDGTSAYTTNDYYKVCSNSISELEAYSWQEHHKALTPCGTCMKDYIPTFQVASQQSLEDDLDELNQRLESASTEETKTEIQRLITTRRGQGEFRTSVLKLYPQCPISGVDMPELLIASHIKPWCDCNDDNERLDQHNGLMLAPNIDALFDSGLITFESDGKIRISKRLSKENLLRLGISPDAVLEIHPDSEKYFEWHRNKVFKP
ncbi:HNH endonuclease [Eikenella corrodens]|uniref:HNH endonuclease n=1 Tax=Eikenella corrodens TaxID=539 RepID=UPI0007D08F3B|nr:HNH endonuclease [Eikenella corrodens]OAM27552.1 hypothetical protein A7P93_08630 [Eikenella corrodens]